MIERRRNSKLDYARENFKSWLFVVVAFTLVTGFIYLEVL